MALAGLCVPRQRQLLGHAAGSQETNSAEVDINIDEMRRTNHISLARVAANGAAPPGAQA